MKRWFGQNKVVFEESCNFRVFMGDILPKVPYMLNNELVCKVSKLIYHFLIKAPIEAYDRNYVTFSSYMKI